MHSSFLRTSRTFASIALSASLLLGAAGCASFSSVTPPGFVSLKTNDTAYKYRATTADGLVLGVRRMKHKPRGEIGFWERAVENQLRTRGGYALLDKRDVTSEDGTPGRQLRFGHDEGAQPHLYYVTIFVTKRRLFLLEAGGTKDLVEKNAQAIEQHVTGFRIK
jgi:hypothetical protein